MPDPRPHRPDPDDAGPDDPDGAVRRLLADARHDEPVPDHVAARLDRVLAGLRSESQTTGAVDPLPPVAGEDAEVVDLDARRHRRRTVTRLLLGAAAVVVVGVGIAQTVGSHDSQPDTASSVQRQSSGDSAGDSSGDGRSSTPDPAPQASSSGAYAELEPSLPVRLRSDALDRDVRRALVLIAQQPPSLQSTRPLAAALSEPLAGWSCGSGTSTRAYGSGILLPATYDGRPVVLALRSSAGDGVPVEVLACGSAQVLRTTTVDAT